MNSPVTPVSRSVRAAKRKAPKPTLDALAAEFEQNPQMAEALATARRELGGLVGDGPGSFRGLRLGAGLSQAGLAARAGLTQSHVALIESGRNDPTTGTVAKLAKALGASEHAVFQAIRAKLGTAAS
jgi:DNA-binding XRE family transcriptional regulator